MKINSYKDYLVDWIKTTVSNSKLSGVILGLSGGADSVVLAALAKIASPQNSLAVFFKTGTNNHKLGEVEKLAALIDLDLKIVDLSEALSRFSKATSSRVSQVSSSSISRLVMTSLYALGQEKNYMVLGTPDASEILVGDFVKYGNYGADALPISGLTKHDIQDLIYHLDLPKTFCDKVVAGSGGKSTWNEKFGVSINEVDDFIEGKSMPKDVRNRIIHLSQLTEQTKLRPIWPKPPRDLTKAAIEKYPSYLITWIRDVVSSLGAKGVVFGLSGGADSSVVAALCKAAFPHDSLGVIMPVGDMHEHLVDAKEVASVLSLESEIINLTPLFESLNSMSNFGDKISRYNIKPRIRMTTLYAIAEAMNYVVVGTSNASEWLIGYFTKYGDGAADLYPLINMPKYLVQSYILTLGLPPRISTKTPTADLWPGQSLSTELGYTYVDVDGYLLGKKINPEISQKIELLHKKTEHKRNAPYEPISLHDFSAK